MRRLLVFFFLTSVFSILGLGLAVAEPAPNIRIGGIFDLSSGAGIHWGTAEKNSFLMAIKDFEAEHPQVKINYQIEDSAYSHQKSISAFHKLTSLSKIRYLVGPTWEVFVSVIPLCESRGIICIAPSCNNEAFAESSLKNTFTLWFDERDYSLVHSEQINSSGYTKVALFGAISPYYDALVDSFLKNVKIKPAVVQRVQPGETDFRTLIAKVPKRVDALVVFLLGDGAAQSFFKQWVELRFDRPEVYTDDAVLYYHPPFDLTSHGFKIFYSKPDLSSPELERFAKRYQRKYGERPQAPSGGVAYDATMILLECIFKNDSNFNQVRNCIKDTRNYPGISGKLSFGGSRAVKERKMKIERLK